MPSNEVTFQSVVEPATAVAVTGVEGTDRLHEVVAAALLVVVVGEADDDEHPAAAPRPPPGLPARRGGAERRCRGGTVGGARTGRIGGVLHRDRRSGQSAVARRAARPRT